MAREKRRISPTGIYHVLLRGIDELFSEEKDFEEFTALIKRYFSNSPERLLGYALLKNRVHLVVDEGAGSLSAVMKPICTSYARYYNRIYDLQGKLFYDRYKSEPINSTEDLSGLMAFLSALPSEHTDISKERDAEVSLEFTDDYCRMTDDELAEYIEHVFSCTIAGMTKDEKRLLAERAAAGGKIGAGRIYSILGLGRKQPVKKTEKPRLAKEQTKRTENTEKNEKESDSRGGLSVWLL